MLIPFTKAHGAKNDFLLTPRGAVSGVVSGLAGLPEIARAICDRNTGIGADGWMLVDGRPGIRLFNSDGSEPELSGNGTRCAAAYLIYKGSASTEFAIVTGAGTKHLKLLSRDELAFQFEMNMGRPRVIAKHFELALASGPRDVSLIDCGNPQCAVPVANFDFDWIALGAEIEKHPHFPHRTNVSFLRPIDEHTIEVRFYERGAGATMSSGTGSTGAAVCVIERGMAASPLRVLTAAGPIELEQRGDLYLTGPAVIIGEGEFFYHGDDEHRNNGSADRR
jgi:diaminopimelate epimerase